MNNQNVTLTKSSEENEIKTYFKNVLELKQSGEEFPVNLDDVWVAVYERKEESVRALKEEFLQGIDYQILRKNAEKSKRGRPSENYYLSISCMEWFVARKVRQIFEVYRQVFHRVAEQKPLSQFELMQHSLNILIEQDKRISKVESKVDAIIEKQQEAEAELKALPLSTEAIQDIKTRDKVRMLVNRYCNATGLMPQSVWDNVYTKLYYMYHIHIKSYKRNKNESWLDIADKKGFIDKMHTIISGICSERGITTL